MIVGFQVRPSTSARRLAEKEEIEIRLYSIIYDAINDIKDAIEGMLAPVMKEEIVCSVEVMETFKITKVGTVAGCLVREGKITRNTNIRVIRDGIVVYTGKLGSLKRFKDDVKEVTTRSGMRSEHRELQRCPRGRHYRGLRAGRGETQVDHARRDIFPLRLFRRLLSESRRNFFLFRRKDCPAFIRKGPARDRRISCARPAAACVADTVPFSEA